jgi:hypothetical protein
MGRIKAYSPKRRSEPLPRSPRLTCTFDPAHFDALQKEAKGSGLPFSEIVRRRLLAYESGEIFSLQTRVLENLQIKVEALEGKIDILLEEIRSANAT